MIELDHEERLSIRAALLMSKFVSSLSKQFSLIFPSHPPSLPPSDPSLPPSLLIVLKYYLMNRVLVEEVEGLMAFIAVSKDATLVSQYPRS